eukprot:TRINITY_DN2075_c0_g3_i1.p2 TRINITY_DN2075_c0_g3~~TRINITY_DN2075_c0_g3_i1.p2  ORF type:complete len:173 (-),score=13.40 TRINITY_DN2075_c0_g3_i1:182-700(-)
MMINSQTVVQRSTVTIPTYSLNKSFQTRKKCSNFNQLDFQTKSRQNSSILKVNCSMESNVGAQQGFSDEFYAAVGKFIGNHKVVVFMKGNRDFPQCGFSNTVVQILNQFQCPYETVDVLSDSSVREGMKAYSQWPTFPQVYIDGEFYGGCDIMLEAYKSGTLQEELERVMLQ